MTPRAASRRLSMAALLLALPLTACTAFSSAQAASTSTSQPGLTSGAPADLAKFYGQRLVWTTDDGCASGYQCSKLTVPLDYAAPGGATIQLAVVRKQAADQAHRLGSLVVNPGGPGGSGISYATSGDVLDSSLLARYDLVGFDPRGVGESAPVECLTDSQMDQFVDAPPNPTTPAQLAEVERESQLLARHCAAKSGAELPFVGTVDAARDMDILRAALGDTKLNYLGKSYGTLLGATYAQEFPKNVGHFVLDGAMDPDLTAEQMNLTQAAAFDKELHLFLDDCVQQTDCPFGTTDPNAAFTKLQTWVNGLNAHPITGDGTRKVDEAYALTGISIAMYDQSGDEQAAQGLGSVLGGKDRGELASRAGSVVGTGKGLLSAPRLVRLVEGETWRTRHAPGLEPLLYRLVSSFHRRSQQHRERFVGNLPDPLLPRRRHRRAQAEHSFSM